MSLSPLFCSASCLNFRFRLLPFIPIRPSTTHPFAMRAPGHRQNERPLLLLTTNGYNDLGHDLVTNVIGQSTLTPNLHTNELGRNRFRASGSACSGPPFRADRLARSPCLLHPTRYRHFTDSFKFLGHFSSVGCYHPNRAPLVIRSP
jgi:hypothetical protein